MHAVAVTRMAEMRAASILKVSLEKTLGSFSIRVDIQLSDSLTILFGPSGAGKSSLLRMLAGLSRPDTGTVVLDGRVLTDCASGLFVPAGERNIGLVMQEPWLFPHMTVWSNVGFGLRTLERGAKAERIAQALQFCEAEELSDRMPAELSGGERQRVALARALAPRPRILLLDEPFAAMDGALKESIAARLIPWLMEENICALYVSHDLAEAYQTGANAIVMRDGAIEAHGPVEIALYDQRQRLLRLLNASSR
jgi:molybdate transport system ATP-binding protein